MNDLNELIETIRNDIDPTERRNSFICLEITPDEESDGYVVCIHIYNKQNLKKELKIIAPTRKIKSNDPIITNHDTCIVCMENYHVGEFKRELPCHHIFHKKCIDKWFVEKLDCPLCKEVIFVNNK